MDYVKGFMIGRGADDIDSYYDGESYGGRDYRYKEHDMAAPSQSFTEGGDTLYTSESRRGRSRSRRAMATNAAHNYYDDRKHSKKKKVKAISDSQAHERRYASLSEKNVALSEKNSVLSEKITTLNEKNSSLNLTIQTLTKELEKSKNKIKDVEEYKSKYRDSQEQYNRLKEEKEKEILRMKKDLEDISFFRELDNSDVVNAKEKVKSYEERIFTMQHEKQSAIEELKKLHRKEINDLKEKIISMEAEKTLLAEESLNREIKSVKDAGEKFKAAEQKMMEENKESTRKLTEKFEKEKNELQERIDELEDQVDVDFEQKYKVAAKALEKAHEEVKNFEEENDELHDKIEELEEAITTLKGRAKAEMEAIKRAVEDSKDEFQRKLAEESKKKRVAVTEVEDLKIRHAKDDKKQRALTLELSNKREAVLKKEAELNKLKAIVTEMSSSHLTVLKAKDMQYARDRKKWAMNEENLKKDIEGLLDEIKMYKAGKTPKPRVSETRQNLSQQPTPSDPELKRLVETLKAENNNMQLKLLKTSETSSRRIESLEEDLSFFKKFHDEVKKEEDDAKKKKAENQVRIEHYEKGLSSIRSRSPAPTETKSLKSDYSSRRPGRGLSITPLKERNESQKANESNSSSPSTEANETALKLSKVTIPITRASSQGSSSATFDKRYDSASLSTKKLHQNPSLRSFMRQRKTYGASNTASE